MVRCPPPGSLGESMTVTQSRRRRPPRPARL